MTKGPFHKGLWAHRIEMLWKILFTLSVIFLKQPGFNFAHVLPARLPWHVCAKLGLDWIIIFTLKPRVFFLQDLDYELINSYWNGSQCAHILEHSADIQTCLQTCSQTCLQTLMKYVYKHWWNMRPSSTSPMILPNVIKKFFSNSFFNNISTFMVRLLQFWHLKRSKSFLYKC